MKWNRPWILLILPLALGLLSGCPWSPSKNPVIPTPPTKYLPQISPANILANLQLAYTDQSIDEYKKLFTEDFTFVFNPADVSNPDDPTPVQWGLVDELASTKNMFDSDMVIRTDLSSYSLGVAERADTLMYGRSAWKVRVDQTRLNVETRMEDGESLIYLVEGTTEVFYFREDSTKPIDGRPTWYIFRWEDQPIGTKIASTSDVPGKPNA